MSVRVVFVVVVGVLVLSAVAFALPNDLTAFKDLYKPKDGTKLAAAGCLTCHDKLPPTKTGLNPYGKDYAKQPMPRGAAAFKAIESLDSDNDGSTSIKEIQLGTLPGDPASKPAK